MQLTMNANDDCMMEKLSLIETRMWCTTLETKKKKKKEEAVSVFVSLVVIKEIHKKQRYVALHGNDVRVKEKNSVEKLKKVYCHIFQVHSRSIYCTHLVRQTSRRLRC